MTAKQIQDHQSFAMIQHLILERMASSSESVFQRHSGSRVAEPMPSKKEFETSVQKSPPLKRKRRKDDEIHHMMPLPGGPPNTFCGKPLPPAPMLPSMNSCPIATPLIRPSVLPTQGRTHGIVTQPSPKRRKKMPSLLCEPRNMKRSLSQMDGAVILAEMRLLHSMIRPGTKKEPTLLPLQPPNNCLPTVAVSNPRFASRIKNETTLKS